MRNKIAFIGVGNMATAIINGMISEKAENRVDIANIIIYDKFIGQTEHFASLGAYVASSEEDAVSRADCVMLCVKPQNFDEVLPKLSAVKDVSSKLFVTIAAGITMDKVSGALGGAPVIRVLPNTPMLIGKGVSAICRTEKVTDEDFSFVYKSFETSSKVVVISEDQMNRIISVTSSSPAYVFLFIRSMLDGAIAQGLLKTEDSPQGLDEKELIDSICDAIIGSAYLMKSGTKTPDEQIKTVASKGGTTEQAVAELEERGVPEAIVSAMLRCTKRADELGKSDK